MKPLGRLKNIKGGFPWKQSLFKIGNWWEEMTEPINQERVKELEAQIKILQELL